MRKLGTWSIKNNVTINLIMIFIIMAGMFTVIKMRREVFPQFSLDMIVISVPYPGSSPEEVEEGICIKIEEEIQSIEGIDRLLSTAREGQGQVREVALEVDGVVRALPNEVQRIARKRPARSDAELQVEVLPKPDDRA